MEAQILPTCSGEDCDLPGLHKTVDSRWLCTEHAKDGDDAFPATCEWCDDEFDASYAMYSGAEKPFCDDVCASLFERDEIDMQYGAKHR